MRQPDFRTNTGREYQKHQHGLCGAVASARACATQLNEAFIVYLGTDNYGYWRKPAANCPAKFAELTAREACRVEPDGSIAILR